MKWLIAFFAVLTFISAIKAEEDCKDSAPDWCAERKQFCHKKWIDLLKKYCRKTCGYCGSGTGPSTTVTPKKTEPKKKVCEDQAPEWCQHNKMHCHTKWIELFKQYCKKTCGYCDEPKPASTLSPGHTNPPYTGICGKPEVKGVRVIAGTTPPRGAWPWQILLIYKDFPNCGGTLIAPNWVVTAAHCVYRRESQPENFVVRVGEYNRTKVEGSEVEFKVAKVIRHEDYSAFGLNNDIALLKLERPAQFNKYVQPACLPSQNPPVGSKCYITGWGKTHHPGRMTDVLQQGLLPVVSNKVCYEKNKHRIHVLVTDAMICGGSGGTDRISGCHGDSGGPFVCNINGKWELHGSVSYGSPVCKSTETYTVFSGTMYFKEWIKNIMAKH